MSAPSSSVVAATTGEDNVFALTTATVTEASKASPSRSQVVTIVIGDDIVPARNSC